MDRLVVDPEIAQLVRDERLLEAARLASQRGDSRLASQLYERACDWTSAAAEALCAGEPSRALELAAEGRSESLAERASLLVAPEAVEATAARLAQRGHPQWAARLLEGGGRAVEAARHWERAGNAARAAELIERSGDPAGAARLLEAALRRDATRWDLATALGSLLARFGRHEAAVRVLQRVPAEAPQRREALGHLVPVLERLGLTQAARDASLEWASREESPMQPAAVATSDPAQPEVHRRLFGRYDVVRDVASSPSARVLECLDVVRLERVAVKVFAGWGARGGGRDALAHFEREVRTMRALDHPNIVPCRDYVPEGPAIVLTWMAGGTLERLLASARVLAPARAVEIALGVLSALGEAHRLGILHRDVKPANILFDEAGGARLSDFGVAHLGDVSTTATAGVFGTLAYMSPEQREGRPATARSDVFAVGTILREMLTGKRPVAREPPRLRPSEAHRELRAEHDAVVAHLTDYEESSRPADAFEARAALLALAWPPTVDTVRPPSQSEGRTTVRPRPSRLEKTPDGGIIDSWTGRRVEILPLSDRALARARAFAQADDPSLQGVLRVDREEGTLWLEGLEGLEALEAPRSKRLDRALTAAERTSLGRALDALHAAGAAHGAVDANHIVVGDAGVVLLFEPEQTVTATVDLDRLALARL